MRATLIHNPTAGDERPTADDLRSILEDAGFQVRYQSSKKDWRKALEEPPDVVVVAGGDGTISKVLKHMAGRETPVAPLPLGTANNIGRSLGLLGDARELIDGWKGAEPDPFDLGICIWPSREMRFAEGCGGGLFAAAVEEGKEQIEKSATLLGKETDRALTFLERRLEEAQPVHWVVDVDGRDASGEYLDVEVLNIPFAGPSVPLAPDSESGDGLFDVVLVRDVDRAELLDYLAVRRSHAAGSFPKTRIERGRHIILAADGGTFRVDDEAVHLGEDDMQESRVQVSVIPAAVRLLLGDRRVPRAMR